MTVRARFRRAIAILVAACVCSSAHALYDPKPDPALAATQGAWTGSLRYRDYQHPDRMVTLPTRLFVALSAPDALVLHYVFDDGPGKTVYSYENMRFDFAKGELAWVSGDEDRSETTYRIVSSERTPGVARIVFEGPGKGDAAGGRVRYTIELGAERMTQKKEEVDAAGVVVVRNTFTFERAAAAR